MREFFQKTIPRNRLQQTAASQKADRLDLVNNRRQLNNEFQEIDDILAGDWPAQYEQDVEFVNDLQGWLALQRVEEEQTTGNKHPRSDTLEEEREALRLDKGWLTSIKQPRYLGYQPDPMGRGADVYTGGAVVEGYKIPGINIPPITIPGLEVPGFDLPAINDPGMVEVTIPGVGNDGSPDVPINTQPFTSDDLLAAISGASFGTHWSKASHQKKNKIHSK